MFDSENTFDETFMVDFQAKSLGAWSLVMSWLGWFCNTFLCFFSSKDPVDGSEIWRENQLMSW